MAQNIPMASAIVAGLLSQEDKIKLDALPGSITGTASDPLSASVVRANQLSASYFSMSSGSANILSASLLRAHNLSASYFEFISGNVQILTGTGVSGSSGTFHVLTGAYLSGNTLTVQDLIVINSNITASAALLSASIIRAHNLSASYFSFVSGNIRTLTGTGIGTTWLSATSGTIDVITASYLTGTEFCARTGSFSIESSHIMTATNFTASSGSIHVLTGAYVSTTLISGTGISGSSGTFHVLTGAYFTSTISQIRMLSGSHAFIVTASIATLSASTAVRAFNLSASYFEIISGNVRTLTGTGISGSSGTFHVLTGAYFTSTISQIRMLSGSHAFIVTASIATLSASTAVRAFNLSASYFEIISGNVRTLTGTGISGSSGTFHTLTGAYIVSTLLTGTGISGSSGTFHTLTGAYIVSTLISGTGISGSSGTFHVLTGACVASTLISGTGISGSSGTVHVLTAAYVSTTLLSGTGISGSSGTFHVFTSSYFSGISLTIQDLVIVNSNITASSILLSASTVRAHNLSASYFEFISGNVRTLTGTGISGSSGTFHILTGAYVNTTLISGTGISGSSGTFHVATASYLSATRLTVTDLVVINTNMTGGATDPLSSSIVRAHQLSASYFQFISGNIENRLRIRNTLEVGHRGVDGAASVATMSFDAEVGSINVKNNAESGIQIGVNRIDFLDHGTFISASTIDSIGTPWIGIFGTLTGTGISGSSGTFHVLTASYLSATRLTVQDLVVINTNISASAASGAVIQAHNLSASYFEFISGNVRTLTGTGIGSTWLSASSGTFHILTASYFSSSYAQIDQLYVSNLNLNLGSGSIITGIYSNSFSSDNWTKSTEVGTSAWSWDAGGSYSVNQAASRIGDKCHLDSPDTFILSGSFAEAYISVLYAQTDADCGALSISISDSAGNWTEIYQGEDAIQTSGQEYLTVLVPSEHMGENARIRFTYDVTDASAQNPTVQLYDVTVWAVRNPFGMISGSIVKTHQFSASYFSMSSGSVDILSASRITVQDLIVQNSNITATIGATLSASTVQAFNLSASYFEFISGNVRTLTGTTSITSPIGVFTDLVVTNTNITATIPDPLSSSVQRAHNLSASYFEFISGNVRTLTGTGIGSTWLSASSGTFHIITGSYQTSTISQIYLLSASYGNIASASNRSIMLSGVANIAPVVCYVSNTNFSQAASTLQAIPFMSHSIKAGEVWKVECLLSTILTGAAGVRFSIAAPTGALISGFIYGTGSAASASSPVRITGTNAEIGGTAFTTITLTPMPVIFMFTIINGATEGTVAIQSRRIGPTTTLFVSTGSYYAATKARFGEGNML